MKKKWIAAIIIYLALLLACIIVIYAVPSLRGMLEKTYVTEYGKIDIADEVSAYIVRDETVYVAGQDSKVTRLAEPGVLTKAKTPIVELEPIVDEEAEAAKETGPEADSDAAAAAAEANGVAPDDIARKYVRVIEELGGEAVYTEKGKSGVAGYISYEVDGAEVKMGTGRLPDLNQSEMDTFLKYKKVATAEGKCGKGDPVFKVIHNSKWYLVFYIDSDAGEKYYEGRTVSVDLGGKNVPCKVYQVMAGEKTTKVTLQCKAFFDEFFGERSLRTTVTLASAEGLVLQDSSIVMKGEQPGVFVKNKLGEHKFKPISVKADDGQRCVVYSDIYVDADGNYVETLKTYDEIVAEPSEEEIAELQVQAEKEAAEKAKKEAQEKAAAEAAEKAAAEQAAREKAQAEAAAKAAEAAENGEAGAAAGEASAGAAAGGAADASGTQEIPAASEGGGADESDEKQPVDPEAAQPEG